MNEPNPVDPLTQARTTVDRLESLGDELHGLVGELQALMAEMKASDDGDE